MSGQEICDPSIEKCTVDDLESLIHTDTLQWLTVLYNGQAVIVPILYVAMLPFGINFFSGFSRTLMWLQFFAWAPAASILTLNLFFGDKEGRIGTYLANASIWTIAYG